MATPRAWICLMRPIALGDLAGVEAGQHLVQQDDARLASQGPCQLEELSLVQVQLVGAARSPVAPSPVNSSQRRASARAWRGEQRAAPNVAASATLSSAREVRERVAGSG